MKKIIALIGLIIFSNCTNKKEPIITEISTTTQDTVSSDTETSLETPWYIGGTLHRATIAEWKNATEENKLATCGDFIAAIEKDLSMTEMKDRATELKECINEATKGLENTNSEKISSIASVCNVALGH